MRRLPVVLAVLAVSATLAAAADDPAAAARGVAEAFRRAVAAGDADAVIALYADDARVVWPGRGEEATGKDAIAALVRRALPEVRGAELTIVSLDARLLAPDTIAVVGRWESATDARKATVRTTEVLVKRDGGWKYLIDHASIGAAPPPRQRRGQRRERRAR